MNMIYPFIHLNFLYILPVIFFTPLYPGNMIVIDDITN